MTGLARQTLYIKLDQNILVNSLAVLVVYTEDFVAAVQSKLLLKLATPSLIVWTRAYHWWWPSDQWHKRRKTQVQ